jgi:hypothetical protein
MGKTKTKVVRKTKRGHATSSKVAKIGSHGKQNINAEQVMISNGRGKVSIQNVSSASSTARKVTAKNDIDAISRANVRKARSSFGSPPAYQSTNEEYIGGSTGGSATRNHVPQSIILPDSSTMITPLTVESMTPAQRWNSNVQDPSHDKKRTQRELEIFVKTVLFKKLKFITSREDLSFSLKEDSLCHHICRSLNITATYRYIFWKDNKSKVSDTLNKKRTDVNSAMKKEYICT